MADSETTKQPDTGSFDLRNKIRDYATGNLPAAAPTSIDQTTTKSYSNDRFAARTSTIRAYDDHLSSYDDVTFTDSRKPNAAGATPEPNLTKHGGQFIPKPETTQDTPPEPVDVPIPPIPQERIIDGSDGSTYIIQPDGSWREYKNNIPTGSSGDRSWVDAQLKGEEDPSLPAAERVVDAIVINRDEAIERRTTVRERLANIRKRIKELRYVVEYVESEDVPDLLRYAYDAAERRGEQLFFDTLDRIQDAFRNAPETLRRGAEKMEDLSTDVHIRVNYAAQLASFHLAELSGILLHKSLVGKDNLLIGGSRMCIDQLQSVARRAEDRRRKRVNALRVLETINNSESDS